MDHDELQSILREYDERFDKLLKEAGPASTATEEWASATHAAVKMLLEVTMKQQELFVLLTQYNREATSAHELTVAKLTKLKDLEDQFHAVQEIFGQRLARSSEMNSPPLFSVVPGGKDGKEET